MNKILEADGYCKTCNTPIFNHVDYLEHKDHVISWYFGKSQWAKGGESD